MIQGVENCLAEEGSENGRGGKSYRRRIDASLVDALYLMVNANSQTDVLDAEKRVRGLMKDPSEFPMEVNERVIKATAMAGLVSLSLSLLKVFLTENEDTLPSTMAYTAVLNILRKNGRIDRLEETLADLASSCRRITQKTGKKVGIDLVAFNTYLAALCDAAVNELPFSSASNAMEDYGMNFNFTSLTNSSTVPTSSSEKYLYKALNLVKGDVARTRFVLEGDPDKYSFNSILNAAAKCSKSDNDNPITNSIMLSCLRGMKERGIQEDVLTYNARIQAALASDEDEAAIQLIDQLISDPSVEPDRYTINFILKPFLKAGRRDEIWSILRDFYDKNAGSNNKIVSSAFEAFLNTIVVTGDIEFAREIFQSFFLPTPRQNKRMQVSQMIHVMKEDEQLQQIDETNTSRRSVELSKRPPARTRHFNILFGGYSKAYVSAISRFGKSPNSMAGSDDITNATMPDNDVINNTVPDTQKVYELLDIMLGIGVPLDGFSVTSLMALPSTPENITSLLKRIEPEMMVELSPAAYRSIISAYARTGDASSACWMFEEMIQSRGNQGRNTESWNVILGALAKGCVGANGGNALDILNSSAARARRNLLSETSDDPESQVISCVNGKPCLDASMAILDIMRNGTVLPEGFSIPKPNSQSYCLVASALSGYGISEPDSDRALNLFRNAMDEGVAADGRFLNAVLRCFGDDIEGALAAWKSDIGPAAAGYERIRSKNTKSGTNLIAAYNGLMHVCGRAIRPDAATRIAYAMNKANVEPTEATLNSYFAGKRVALDGSDDDKNLGLRNQYETLLSVECTKYNTKDKRQANDRKIRIILS